MRHFKGVFFCFSGLIIILIGGFFVRPLPEIKKGNSKEKNRLIIGINGHPLNQLAYSKMSVAMQFDVIKKLGINYYRFDAPIDYNGSIKNEKTFYEMTSIAKVNNIGLLPMVYMIGLDFKDDTAVSYKKGYVIGDTFAKKYGRYFHYYELGNEEDLLITKKGTSGSNPDDYDIEKLKTAACFWKGMIKAIKVHDPHALIVINTGGWFHYVFFDLLTNQGVNYDIIGYHWYSDMDDYSKTVNVNISKLLTQKFHKPVWFTEINISNGTNGNTEEKQNLWISSFIKSCRKYPGVEAVFIYELLDEPDLINVDESERYYGIMKLNKNKISTLPRYTYKLVGKSLK